MLEKVKNRKRFKAFLGLIMSVFVFSLSAILFIGIAKNNFVRASYDAEYSIFYPNLTSSLSYSDATSIGAVDDFVRDNNGLPISFQFTYSAVIGSSSVSTLTLYCYVTSTSSTAYVTSFRFYSGTPNISNPYIFTLTYVATSGLLTFNSLSTNGPISENVRYYLSTSGLRPFSTTITGTSSVTNTTINDTLDSYTLFSSCFNAVANSEGSYLNGLAEGRNYGYQSGYNEGYETGYSEGSSSIDTSNYYQSGYDTGFSAGVSSVDTSSYYNNGYQLGYQAGLDNASNDYGITDLLFSIFSTPLSVLQSIFSFTIFGVTAWSAISTLLVLAVVVWILKKFFSK